MQYQDENRMVGGDAMKRPLYVVATEGERARFVPAGEESIVTGVGYANVFGALKSVPRDRQIINIGYAGSNKIPVGKLCNIAVVENYHPNTSYESDKIYILEDDGVINGYVCYTSNDFVSKQASKIHVYSTWSYTQFAQWGFLP